MVRIATLRCQTQPLLHKLSMMTPEELKYQAMEAHDIDTSLEQYAMCLDLQYAPSAQTQSRSLPLQTRSAHHEFEITARSYSSHSHASDWNRYRALLIIVKSIRIRLLRALVKEIHPENALLSEIGRCQQTITEMATDMLNSIPYFYIKPHKQGTTPIRSDTGTEVCTHGTDHEIIPLVATLLAWPLTVAVCAETVPEPQKSSLKGVLQFVASITGDNVPTTVHGKPQLII